MTMNENDKQAEPVAAESRFDSEKTWGRCTIEHHYLVQSEPHKWPGYQTRLLYTEAPAVAAWKSDDEALQIFRKTRGDELTLNMFKEEILNAVNAPPVAVNEQDIWDSALELAALTIQLFDEATLTKDDYMLDASECARIILALKAMRSVKAEAAKGGV